MSVAAPIVLRPGDGSTLRTVLRYSTAGAGVAQRARIVLLAAGGVPNAEIARRVGLSRPTVLCWRGRYEQSGIAGLGDLDRSGRPPVIDELAVVVAGVGGPADACYQRHTHAELLDFLKLVAKAYPRVTLHVVADSYATHKHPKVKAWLAKSPRVTMHFTPTSGSWMNMVGIFFGITRQAVRRGTFTSVKDLITAIENFIDGWNERCQPFTWTETADDILAKAHRKTTSNTRH